LRIEATGGSDAAHIRRVCSPKVRLKKDLLFLSAMGGQSIFKDLNLAKELSALYAHPERTRTRLAGRERQTLGRHDKVTHAWKTKKFWGVASTNSWGAKMQDYDRSPVLEVRCATN